MIHAKQNLMSLLVVSLLVAVISLPGVAAWAAVAPKAQAMPPVREGMMTPVRMAMHSSGNYYYVTDFRAKAVLKYNIYGQLVQTIATAEPPQGIALAANGDIVVTQVRYVVVLDPTTGAEKTPHMGLGVIGKASAIAVDGNTNICVTDPVLHQVHIFSSTGSYIKSIGGFGQASATVPALGLFQVPTAIAYEKANRQIAVGDGMNGRIQFFNISDYTYAKQIGKTRLNDDFLDFISPQGIAFEYDSAIPPNLNNVCC